MLSFALADAADNGVGGPELQALNVISSDTWLMFVPAIGVWGIASGAGMLQTGIAPRWLGWMAVVLGVLCFVPIVSFFGFLLSAVWIVAASVKFARVTS